MVSIRPKSKVNMAVSALGETHARSTVSARGVSSKIDEPVERQGTNQGLTPTETLMASLIGCTNVISKRIAHRAGFRLGEMKIELTAGFDRRGTMLEVEVDRPFSDIQMDIQAKTDATPAQFKEMQADLARFCPIAKVIRGSGVTITERWTALPFEESHD